MTYGEFIKRTITAVIIAATAIILALLVTRLYPILIIGLLSWIISVGLSIPINFFRRRGLKRGAALLVTFLITIIVLALFTRLLLPSLVGQADDLLSQLPQAAEAAVERYDNLRDSSDTLTAILPQFTLEDYRQLLHTAGNGPSIDVTSIAQSSLPVIADVGGFLGNILVNLLLVFFVTIYLTVNPLTYYRMFIALTPAGREQRTLEILEMVRQSVIVWIGSMVLEVTITAIMIMAALGLFLRLPNSIALGILAGLGNIVPYIGYWAALIPILIFAAAEGGLGAAALAFILYFIVGVIEANVILPANIGNRLKLPAALILLFQGIAATLLGFLGVLLAVPILAIVMVIVRELFVFDTLGKRGSIPRVFQSTSGELILGQVEPDGFTDAGSQETPLTVDEV